MSTDVLDGASPPGTGDSARERPGLPGKRRFRWVARVAGIAVMAGMITGFALGARYQPVAFGGMYRPPAGPHLISKQVNGVGDMSGQTFISPQPSEHATMLVSLANSGPLPVTIESLRLLPPGLPADADSGFALRISGTPTYTPAIRHSGVKPPGPRRLAGAVLHPGENILARVPVVTAPCWFPHTTQLTEGIWVITRSLLWTHHVFVRWTDPGQPTQGAVLTREGYWRDTTSQAVCPG